ncbi:MAG TPA: hypothetical protein VF660_07500 [Actinomycetota bacterium]
MKAVRVAGFAPSTSGFHFANAFPSAPVIEFGRGSLRLPVGNAADGLCGGMIFAARDLFEAGHAPPADTEPPAPRSPLFRHLVRRLFDSFDLPSGPIRYLTWTALPESDTRWGLRGLAWRSVRNEWPKVKRDLDRGVLAPLGVVRLRSLKPWKVGQNHQLLAYGYDLDERPGRVFLQVYDPNHPDADDLTLKFDLEPTSHWKAEYVEGELPVRGFFRTRYRPRPVPGDLTATATPRRGTRRSRP